MEKLNGTPLNNQQSQTQTNHTQLSLSKRAIMFVICKSESPLVETGEKQKVSHCFFSLLALSRFELTSQALFQAAALLSPKTR